MGTRSEAHAKPASKRDMQKPAATCDVAANKRGSRRRQQRKRNGKSRAVTSVEKNGQRHGGDSCGKERPAGMLQVLPDLILTRISSFLGEVHELKAFRATCKPALDAVRSNDDAALILRGRHSEQQWRMFDDARFGSQLRFLSIQYCNITSDALEAILERHAATLEFVQCNKLYAAHFSEALLAQPERYPALRAFGNCGLLGAYKSGDATNQAILRAWQAVPNGPAFGALQAVALTNMRLQAPLVVALMSCGNLEELHLAGSFLVDWDKIAPVEGAPPARTRLRALEATFVEQSDIDALVDRVEPKPAIVNYIKTSTVPHAWGTGAGRICARSSLVARNKDGRSALHVISSNLCAGADIENECATLIRLGADFLQRDNKSRTALHVACLYNQPALLRAVWNASADGPMQILEAMKLRTIVGESPLYVAALKGFDDCVEIMCDAVKRHIEAAPQAERDEVRSSLLHKLVNADLWTPLHGAAIGGHLRCADLLLEIGFHPQMRTKDSETSLHAACFTGHLDMLNKLLAHGGSLDAAAEIVAVRANQGQCADFVRRVLRESGHASAVGDRPRRKPKSARGSARRQTRQAPAGKKNKAANAQKNDVGRRTSVALPSAEPST